MKTSKRARALSVLFLTLCMLGSLIGCGNKGNEKYNIVTRLQTQKLCVAFRLGDKAGDAVIAALKVLQAEGEITKLSLEWFNEDRSLLTGDANALEALGEVGERTCIIGYDPAHMPYSGDERSGIPAGFDIDLARLVCRKLNWKTKFLPVDVANAETELKSGNVDCIWGGYAMDEGNASMSFSPVYMENTVIIASLNGSGIRNESSLKEKTLAVSETGQFSAALDTKPEVSNKPVYVIRLPGGVDDCFKALEEGSCDAIVTDIAAIEYYR